MNVQFKISDKQLLDETKKVAKQEQLKTLELLSCLTEIDRRMAYVKLGYTSLFAYLTQELGYSGSEAALRVNAMRLLKKVPEAQEKIAAGTLTLSSAASIQGFSRAENVSTEKVKQLVEDCEHKSTREVTKILEERRGVKKVEFVVKLTGQAAEKFARLKKLFPDLSDVELLEGAIEEKLTRIKLGEKKSEEFLKINPTQKSIPRTIQRTLFTRAQNQCEYVDPKTKKRCSSQTNLQCDHVYPRAWGGPHETGNLRILCRTHNLASAYSSFGTDKMAKFRSSSS